MWDKGPFFQLEMTEYAEQLAFYKGVEFIIEKACDWLYDNMGSIDRSTDTFVNDFRKAMEETK